MENVRRTEIDSSEGRLHSIKHITEYFSSFTLDEMRNRITCFKEQEADLKSSVNPEQYMKALASTLDITTNDGRTIRPPLGRSMSYSIGTEFIRAYRLKPETCNFETNEFSSLVTAEDNLWQAPVEYTNVGRFNKKGAPLLYTCLHTDNGKSFKGVVTETQLHHNEVYILIFYKAFKPLNIVDVSSVAYTPSDDHKEKANMIIEFIAECLFESDRSNFELVYMRSLATLNYIYNTDSTSFVGWGVPSVKVEGANNICFPPEQAKTCLYVDKAYVCQFKDNSNGIAVLAETRPIDNTKLTFAKPTDLKD